jgi:phenylacetate-CoA ligase
MEEFAKFINRNQIKVYSPKLIVTTIGPLYEQARNEIEKAFRCPVYNQYGSREVGWIAFEDDKHQKLDTCFWRQLIELEGQGNEKELVITTLDNYSMPLIRYKIGDVATPGVYKKIGKTKSYFTIKNVLGRTLGFFKLADGSLKHTHFIVQQLFFRNWIEQFQLIQQDYDEVLIKIVGKENKKEMREIDDLILKFLGDNFEITWKFVDKIPPTKSGKYLYTLSKVK